MRVLCLLALIFLTACMDAGELVVETEDDDVIVITTEPPTAPTGPTTEGPNSVDPGSGTTPSTEPTEETATTPEIPTCNEGQAFCMGGCIDVTMDDANCGDCGVACGDGLICVASECGCEVGELCGSECVDTSANQMHCGRCDNPCLGGQVCDGGQCVTLSEVDAVLVATNNVRAQGADCGVYGQFGPTGPLSADPNLNTAAQAHALDMANNNFFSHTGSDGSSFVDRIQRTDFSGQPIGENIAAGQRSAEGVVASWVESDGHCRSLMNPQATKIGIGYTPGGPYGTLWVQVFAR